MTPPTSRSQSSPDIRKAAALNDEGVKVPRGGGAPARAGDTRKRRLAQAIAQISEGKPQNWKYHRRSKRAENR